MSAPRVHPTAIVPEGAEIAADAVVGPYCILSAKTKLAAGVVLESHVIIQGDVSIGARTKVWPLAVLGGPPQIANYHDIDTKLVIGADNVIREHVTMHRGSPRQEGVTRVGSGGMFMAQSHVGHDCVVGDHVILAQSATLGGHVQMADDAYVGGHAAVHQFVRIGRRAFVGGVSAVTRDVAPYALANGTPATIMGPNLRGLLRRNVPRPQIRALRAAYQDLFFGEGVLEARIERLQALADKTEEVDELLAFVKAPAKRPLMTGQAA